MQPSILIGLNEINFAFIEKYIAKGELPTFKKIFEKYGYARTTSESRYELLEPWIQWVSIHTGKAYDEHGVFRLGDIVDRPDLKQLWEIAEEKGLLVGAVSPFNARNNLKKACFFVPDPWTVTEASGTKLVRELSAAVSKAVNNNANNKLDKKAAIVLLKGFLSFVPTSRYPAYLKLILNIHRKATKAAILDNILSDVFIALWKKYKPDFSSLFLNSGAHEQHHYMFNAGVYEGQLKNPDWYIKSDEDPVLDILREYDAVMAKMLKLNCRLFIATGLHQNPHLHDTYYWRLKDHKAFLDLLHISYAEINPRMSRDFLIVCENNQSALETQQKLQKVTLNGIPVFTIDNREDSLFVELTYDRNVSKNDMIQLDGKDTNVDLHDYVSFVAIKNGEHDQEGYFIDTAKKYNRGDEMKVTKIFDVITASFN